MSDTKLRAYWRAFRGYCPACNSDAPECDNCKVCLNWRGTFPPQNWLPAIWLQRHFGIEEFEGGQHAGK